MTTKKPTGIRGQEGWLMGPAWGVEQTFWKRLVKDFKAEIACINMSLAVLKEIDDSMTQQIFKRDVDEVIDDLKKRRGKVSQEDIVLQLLIDRLELSRAVCAFLVTEALDRLIAARLLIFTGHMSRALSCIRDAYECLRYSDICRMSKTEGKKWLEGKKVRVPKGFVFAAPLAQDNSEEKLFNKWGTHAYLEAVLVSAMLGPFHPESATIEGTDRIYKENSLSCMGLILLAIQNMLRYLVMIHKKAEETTPEIAQVYKLISRNLELINERLSDT
jgi:hypothetical protein